MNKHYPRWITRPDGATIMVNDHIQHGVHMGKKFNSDATEVVDELPAVEAVHEAPVEIPEPAAAIPPVEDDDEVEACFASNPKPRRRKKAEVQPADEPAKE